MPVIPMYKVIPEVFKTATKPLINAVKTYVKKSPFWRDSVFLQMARSKQTFNV